MGVMVLVGGCGKDKATITRENLRKAMDGVQMFQATLGRFPTTQEGLAALITCPCGDIAENWRQYGPFFKGSELPKDGWGRPLCYATSSNGFRIWSLGGDGKDGTSDDIVEAAKAE